MTKQVQNTITNMTFFCSCTCEIEAKSLRCDVTMHKPYRPE